MAHALLGYDGPCRHIHGHSYELTVTVTGIPSTNPDDPKIGMVMDFKDLKQIVKSCIVDEVDHALMLNQDVDPEMVRLLRENQHRVILVPYQPTTENMLFDFAVRIQSMLPKHIRLEYLRLRETVTSYAEWFALDQE
jgi:6-pyruvoyltetrahydropterin/6-carboxytetrahydropterin synthase